MQYLHFPSSFQKIKSVAKMYMLCTDEKLSVQASSLFVRKRKEDEVEDEPTRKRGKLISTAGRYPESQYQAPAAARTTGASEVSAADGICHWLPGKLSEGGKSPSRPAEGLLTESQCMPETATCSMDFEDVEGRAAAKKEEYQKDGPKLYLTESASARLTQVLKLESDLRGGIKEPETNRVADELSQMETESGEPEKMPELYYYM